MNFGNLIFCHDGKSFIHSVCVVTDMGTPVDRVSLLSIMTVATPSGYSGYDGIACWTVVFILVPRIQWPKLHRHLNLTCSSNLLRSID
jgi:hypothetical protein